MVAASVDELYRVKSLFYTGSYQSAINTANSLPPVPADSPVAIRKLFYIHRSYLAQKKLTLVLGELQHYSQQRQQQPLPPLLNSLMLYAKYLTLPAGGERQEKLKELVAVGVEEPLGACLAAELLIGEGDFDRACTCLSPHLSAEAECMALLIVLLLKHNRLDVAERQLEALKSMAEDAALTQLCEAWVDMRLGGSKYQEAFYIFEELTETLGSSSKLLVGKAICQMSMGNFADAEKLLMESLNLNNDDPETLANLIVCSQHLRKPRDMIQRYQAQLKDANSAHPLLTDLDLKSSLFDRLAQKFSPTVA